MKIGLKKRQAGSSLTTTLATAFFALSAVVLLISSGVQIYSNFQAQQEIIFNEQQIIAQSAATEVINFIDDQFSAMRTAVKLANVNTASTEEQQQVLNNLLGLQPAFRHSILFDAQDQELVSASRMSRIEADAFVDRLESELFDQVRDTSSYISSVIVDEITSEPLIIIAVASTDIFGDVQGTLVTEVNLKFIWELVDQLKIGETGRAFVVDKNGVLLAYHDTGRVLKGENVSYLAEVNQFITGASHEDESDADISTGINDETVVTTYIPLVSPDWAVMTELPVREAYAIEIRSALLSIGATVVMALLAGVGGAYMARRLAVPITNLTETATQIAAGEHDLSAHVQGPIEVVSLAEAFNSMTGQLQGLIGSLEERVHERTQALETSTKVSRQLSTILEQELLIKEVVHQIQSAFDYYHVHIYLIDEKSEQLIMAGGTGDAGAEMLANNHTLAVGRGLVGSAAETNSARLVPDVSQSENWVANPLLPETQSEIAVPIAIGDEVLGVLDVQSNVVNGLQDLDQELLQAITSQIAIALQNARQYQALQHSQESLRERETLMRTIIDASPDWIFVKDPEHRYVMVNQGFADTLQLSPDELVGKNDLDLGIPEEIVMGDSEKGVAGSWEDEREIFDSGEMKVIDVEPVVVNGEERFKNTIKVPLKDRVGNVTRVVGFVHDITERVAREQRVFIENRQQLVINDMLQKATDATIEEILLQTLDHVLELPWMPVQPEGGVFLSDPNTRRLRLVVHRNLAPELQTLCAMVPYGHCLCGRAAATGKIQFAGCVNDDHDISFEGMAPHGHYNVPLISDSKHMMGVMVFYLEHGHKQDKDEIAFLEAVGRMLANIIQRKQTEMELEKAQNRVNTILESISIPLVISKVADGKVAYVNEPLAEIIRASRDELVGQVTPDFYHDPSDRQAFLAELREKGEVTNYDLRLKRDDGELFWALISGRVIDFQGEPAIITSLMDINERRKAQALVARRAAELQTVAELGNIATTILNPDELLQQVVDLTKDRFELYHAHIYLMDENGQELVLTNGAGETGRTMVAEGRQITLSQEQSLVARAARSRQGVVINNVQADPGFLPHPLLPNTQSEMAVPIIVGNDVHGVLDVQADIVDRFTAEEVNIFSTLAAQIAVALQNARRYEEAQRALDELIRLQRVMSREGWEAFLLAQDRPLLGYAFDSNGVQPISKEHYELEAATNGHGVEVEAGIEVVDEAETAVSLTNASVSIPITVGGEQIGQLGLRTPDGSPIPKRNRRLIQTITHQMSEALERARLYEETEVARNQTETLYKGSDLIVRATNPDEVLQALTNLAIVQKMGQASLSLFDKLWAESPETFTLAAVWNEDAEKIRFPAGTAFPIKQFPIIGHLAENDNLIVENVATDPRISEEIRAFLQQIETASYFLLPLIIGDQWIGFFSGSSDRPIERVSEDDVRQISSLVDQAATVLQSMRLYQAAEERSKELALINKVVSGVSGTLEIDHSLQMVTDELAKVIDGAQVALAMINREKDALTVVAETFDPDRAGSSMGFVIPIEGNFLTQEVIRTRKTVKVTNAQSDPRLAPVHEGMKHRGVETLYVIPMLAGTDVVGTVGIDLLEKGREIDEQQIRLAETIVFQAATAVQNARLFTESQERAEELSLINRISEMASSQLNTTELFNSVGVLFQEMFVAENVYFALYDNQKSIISFPYFASQKDGFHDVEPLTTEDGGLTAKIITTKKSICQLLQQDSLAGAEMGDGDVKIAGTGGRIADSYVGVPMIVGREVVGVIGLSNYSEIRTYTEQDQRLLEILAGTIGVAVQNARQFEETQRRAEREALINAVTQKIQAATTVESALQTAVSELGQALKLKKAAVVLAPGGKDNGHEQH